MSTARREEPGSDGSAEAQRRHDLAEAVRRECIAVAIQAYEDAAVSGLCQAGAFEAAISAVRRADLRRISEGCA